MPNLTVLKVLPHPGLETETRLLHKCLEIRNCSSGVHMALPRIFGTQEKRLLRTPVENPAKVSQFRWGP